MTLPPQDWHQVNQRYLVASLALLQHLLTSDRAPGEAEDATATTLRDAATAQREAMIWPPTLEVLAERFQLSGFERDILLMCAGVELDAGFRSALITAGDGDIAAYPSFGLALRRLPDAHWSALAPTAPLRYWRLLHFSSDTYLNSARLAIDERVLHFLTGIPTLDQQLGNYVETLPEQAIATPTHSDQAAAILGALERHTDDSRPPVVELLGVDSGAKRAVASYVAHQLGVQLYTLTVTDIPTPGPDLHGLSVLWSREVALAGHALYIDADDPAMPVNEPPTTQNQVVRLVDGLAGLVFVARLERHRKRFRPIVSFDIERPRPEEHRMLWSALLGDRMPQLEPHVQHVCAQFRLNLDGLRSAGTEVAGLLADLEGQAAQPDDVGRYLWDACRRQARPQLDDLAQRIEPTAGWEDLILPASQLDALRQVAVHVRHRHQVHEHWRLAARDSRGLGISVLFCGGSGTGKTMAAEVLANELRLDLYRIDVSAVVSKYIGETEKNLRRVFDAAEEGAAILLFDEADALFGKRSEVKDSHDRFANIEVSYLLQRMEAYKGLAVLTTNMKSALDQAFMRRLRFVIEFPFPDTTTRHRIWQGMFPREAPTHSLDLDKLSNLNVAGGNIRNIALGAAFNAADEGVPIHMHHILDAAKREYRKLERPLQSREIKGWS